MDAVIYNARLVDADIDSEGAVFCRDGIICSVHMGSFRRRSDAEKLATVVGIPRGNFIDAEGLALMPSFVDMHAHFRYPGQTQKEDIDSALAAAENGGFGTLVLMPNTNPVVSSSSLAKSIMKECSEKSRATVFQTVSITKDFGGTDTSAIDDLSRDEFPVISEDGHDVASAAVMLEAMEKAGKKGIVVACHCEDVELAKAARPFRQAALRLMAENGIPAGIFDEIPGSVPESVVSEIDGNLSRANSLLALAEDAATERNLEIGALAHCHVHICHCSTKTSMDAVRNAKARGIDCSVEVTPHHLSLVGTEEPNIRALVNPPLRSVEDRRALIEALRDGTADCIGTDHAPHTMEDKAAGSPGFTGLETAFAACHTILCAEEGFSLSRLSELMSANPAAILGLKSGRLRPGFAASFSLVDTREEWIVRAAEFKSKGKSTPLEGKKLVGRVKRMIYC